MKDKYVDRKEEMGKLIEEEYEVEGKTSRKILPDFLWARKH